MRGGVLGSQCRRMQLALRDTASPTSSGSIWPCYARDNPPEPKCDESVCELRPDHGWGRGAETQLPGGHACNAAIRAMAPPRGKGRGHMRGVASGGFQKAGLAVRAPSSSSRVSRVSDGAAEGSPRGTAPVWTRPTEVPVRGSGDRSYFCAR